MEGIDWINAINNVGFPIVITVYLFLRFEKKLENLKDSIDNLTDVIKDTKRVEKNKWRLLPFRSFNWIRPDIHVKKSGLFYLFGKVSKSVLK